MRRFGLKRRAFVAFVAAGFVFGAVTAVQAAVPDSSGVIHSCYNTSLAHGDPAGAVRFIDTDKGQVCASWENAVNFTQNGPTGATGVQGARGTTGPKGATGANGANGARGATGAGGARGATGGKGLDGAKGSTGARGSNGSNGANGANGATGANGANGAKGATGGRGTIGSKGATGAIGANGAKGPTGTRGTIGSPGAIGGRGPSGPMGPNGLSDVYYTAGGEVTVPPNGTATVLGLTLPPGNYLVAAGTVMSGDSSASAGNCTLPIAPQFNAAVLATNGCVSTGVSDGRQVEVDSMVVNSGPGPMIVRFNCTAILAAADAGGLDGTTNWMYAVPVASLHHA